MVVGPQPKLALIVVGRMGHGKSSFCKMIVADEERQKIVAEASIASVTTECHLYRSDRFRDVFGEDIYILDTPGLDSKKYVK